MEHKIDSRILALTEEVGEIRTQNATKTRLSKVEDELIEVKREFQVSDTTNIGLKCIFPWIYIHCMYFVVQRFRQMVHGNTQPTSTAAFVPVRIVGLYYLLIRTNL